MHIPDKITREFLVEFRTVYNLSQLELGKCLGVAMRTVQSWECDPASRNYRKPRSSIKKSLYYAQHNLRRLTKAKKTAAKK